MTCRPPAPGPRRVVSRREGREPSYEVRGSLSSARGFAERLRTKYADHVSIHIEAPGFAWVLEDVILGDPE